MFKSKAFLLLILPIMIVILGCQENYTDLQSRLANHNFGFSNECPKAPTQELSRKNVKEIILTEKGLIESGQIKQDTTIGYRFQAEGGEKLNIQTEDELCTWVFTPDSKLVKNGLLPVAGKYILQVMPKLNIDQYELGLNLEIPQESFNQNRALKLVKQWYEAKAKIFAPPFDADIVGMLTTGQQYNKILVDNDGGSVGWLKNNNCYYTYYSSSINNVLDFSNTEERPMLRANISETLELHGPQSSGCSIGGAKSYTKNVTYWFEQDNGIWKIYHYELED